jgi:hypothetical protein
MMARLFTVALLIASCGGSTAPHDAGADRLAPDDLGQPADEGRPDRGPDTLADARFDTGADARLDTAADAGVRSDAAPDVVAACPATPNPDQTWITAYQTDLLAHLTGDEEVAPGVNIPDRATAANRARARDYLASAFRGLGLTPQVHSYTTGANVFALLESTTGGAQHLVLGAHYDTVALSPGADDNGSGVAAVLAAARQLKDIACRSRPVIFVLFDEEERGLVGSEQFARKLVADKVAVHSVHTVDQVSWDRNGDRLVELELPDTGLRPLYEAAVSALGVTIPLMTTNTRSSDHSSFRPTFPAIGVTEGYVSRDTSPHMHRPTDRLATIDLAYLRSTTVLVMRVFADLVR